MSFSARSSTSGSATMLIVDTGPLIAAAIPSDSHHDASLDLLSHADGPLVVPMLVITEAAHLLLRRAGAHAERAFATSLAAGELIPEPVETSDWPRIHELVDQYADLALGIVDASVVATCERLRESKVASLDKRHLGVVRPRHCPALELLPS